MRHSQQSAILRYDVGSVRWITLSRPRNPNAIETALANRLAGELVLSGRRLSAAGAERACVGVATSTVTESAQVHAEMLDAKPPETYRQYKAWLNRRMRSAIKTATGER
jgi:enoyl-CoA hydratase/carnithine racemase